MGGGAGANGSHNGYVSRLDAGMQMQIHCGCHGLRTVPSSRCLVTTRHPAGRYLARARPAVSVRLRRSSEWGGHTHPPPHRASPPKTLDYIYCLADASRFVFVSVSGLLACSRSHLSAAPFAFVPRLLEPPSALQLPPPAVSISLPIFST